MPAGPLVEEIAMTQGVVVDTGHPTGSQACHRAWEDITGPEARIGAVCPSRCTRPVRSSCRKLNLTEQVECLRQKNPHAEVHEQGNWKKHIKDLTAHSEPLSLQTPLQSRAGAGN